MLERSDSLVTDCAESLNRGYLWIPESLGDGTSYPPIERALDVRSAIIIPEQGRVVSRKVERNRIAPLFRVRIGAAEYDLFPEVCRRTV